MRRSWIAVAGLVALAPVAARAHDLVDTRLNFTITNENMLVKPGETNPSVPGFRIGAPTSLGILFFDNYDTRFSGYENLTHLVAYKRVVGKRFEGEGALVFRFLEFSDVSLSSIDDGSYLKITFFPDASRQKKDNLSLVAFPLSADRMRLGFSYRLSWGGSPMFFKYNPDLPTTAQVPVNAAPAPGARLQWAGERFAIWAGFKTSLLLNRDPKVNEQESIYGVLGGASIDIVKDHLRLDVNGGYFYRGTHPDVYFRIDTGGASVQLSAWNGESPTGSIDYVLYKNDPTSAQRFFGRPVYRPGVNWLAQTEFTVLTTSLQDPARTNSTVRQLAYAGDVNLRLQYGRMRVKLDAAIRSLEFILQNQPSLVPYQAFPKDSVVSADKFLSIGFDYFIQRIGLTIGPTLGLDFPATFTPPSGDKLPQLCGNTMGSLCSSATIVVRGEGDYDILPEKDAKGNKVEPVPVIAAKLVSRLDFLEYFAVILDLYYSHDGNRTHLTKAADGSFLRDFNKPAIDQLGMNLTLQARF